MILHNLHTCLSHFWLAFGVITSFEKEDFANDHPEKVKGRLKNYDLGILKATSPGNLDRLEDYYIDVTHAKLSLNRYKTTQ